MGETVNVWVSNGTGWFKAYDNLPRAEWEETTWAFAALGLRYDHSPWFVEWN